MPDTSVPPGTYAGQTRSPVAWVYLCPSCAGYKPLTSEDYSGALSGQCNGCGSACRELHRFPAHIDSAAGCGCRCWHERVTGDLVARPVLDDSEQFRVEEARVTLACWDAERGGSVYSTERALADHVRALLDLLDKIAPKESDDA